MSFSGFSLDYIKNSITTIYFFQISGMIENNRGDFWIILPLELQEGGISSIIFNYIYKYNEILESVS